jgi:hypothetical protein
MDTRRLPQKATNNLWFHYNESDAVLVFLHGVLSDSRGCWLYEDAKDLGQHSYWPELIESDQRFKNIAIYLAGYYTAPDSGTYEIRNCADEVFAALTRKDITGHPPILAKQKIIFVCHSMGGIVARYLLEANQRDFEKKQVGLVLIASPSYGSTLANSLNNLISFFNQQQGVQLQWGNWSLRDLDDRFRELKEKKQIPSLAGIELYENHFILHWKWFPAFQRKLVVTKESAGRYFGAAKQLAKTDHFSICKPREKTDLVHQYLLDFLSDNALLPGDAGTASSVIVAEAPVDSVHTFNDAQPLASRPRVYVSYTWRTPGMKERVFELAEGLRAVGIDIRIDLYHGKSLHGFLPPDTSDSDDRPPWIVWQEGEVRDADFIILICSQEYAESTSTSGAWHDVQFMVKELESGRVDRRKFIPAGFGPYRQIAKYTPAFLESAHYYDLSSNEGFGLDDLVRRIKSEYQTRPREPLGAQAQENPQPQLKPTEGKGFISSPELLIERFVGGNPIAGTKALHDLVALGDAGEEILFSQSIEFPKTVQVRRRWLQYVASRQKTVVDRLISRMENQSKFNDSYTAAFLFAGIGDNREASNVLYKQLQVALQDYSAGSNRFMAWGYIGGDASTLWHLVRDSHFAWEKLATFAFRGACAATARIRAQDCWAIEQLITHEWRDLHLAPISDSPDASVSNDAVQAHELWGQANDPFLVWHRGEVADEILRRWSRHNHWRVRDFGAQVLASLGFQRTVTPVVEWLRRESVPGVRNSLLHALERSETTAAADAVIEHFTSSGQEGKPYLAKSAWRTSDKNRAITALKTVVDDEDSAASAEALVSLARLDHRCSQLDQMLDSPDYYRRLNSALAVAYLGDKKALDRLIVMHREAAQLLSVYSLALLWRCLENQMAREN